ncbi:TIGR03943 family putative permease subunit [Lysobacter korlensis]|uniref:TIGR03943 family putative permease subunit n=1 Tax=Lysobacter korlensis TaxID=553636 RepID=A0ABV6RTI3_9GAMM
MTGRWTGILLSLVVVIGTLWLAATGDLDLYVHPRYFTFTLVMAGIGGIVSLAALLFLPGREESGEAHEADEATARTQTHASPFLRVGGRLLVLAAATAGTLVLPPATLSPAIAGSRELNAASATETEVDAAQLAGSDGSTFTVKDWASLLRQGMPEQFFTGKAVEVTGFVLATESDDTFYLARYLITHCAIDAQPVGVPVHWPGWREELRPDGWLSLAGAFDSNPSTSADAPIVLIPTDSEQVEEPDDPYVY